MKRERHLCEGGGRGLIEVKHTTRVYPFDDSANVVTRVKFACRKCGATWRVEEVHSEFLAKWDDKEGE